MLILNAYLVLIHKSGQTTPRGGGHLEDNVMLVCMSNEHDLPSPQFICLE